MTLALRSGRFGALSDAPATFVLDGALVMDPPSGTADVREIAVVGGRIAEPALAPADAPRIQADGLVVAPGFCDLHAHLREPGGEDAETVAGGSRAAAHGGFTTVCAMPNTDPPIDDPASVTWLLARASDASCRVRVVAAATAGRAGVELPDYAALAAAGAVAVSDDGASIPTGRLASRAMVAVAAAGLPLIEHAEDASLAAGTAMRAGPVATRLGLAGWPASAEAVVVERDIALAAETGARVHFTHLSTSGSVEAVRRGKAAGLPITCDVTPHHLALTDAWVAGDRRFSWETGDDDDVARPLEDGLAYDGRCRVNPPLPSREDALALLGALADGTVDAIATDHAPHPPQRKAVPFEEASPGMIGLETALSVGLAAVDAGRLSLRRLIEALSISPARVIGEERSLVAGRPADLVVFDPASRWTVDPRRLAGGSHNTPLLGRELPGLVRLTVAAGRVTWDDGLLA
ncbi:MAG TPA: dihydroorotase [Candidatus Limnocylindria bacterium]|nr:dihydroorotase [Candidatus Limnocylindria bacterium]